MKIALILIFLLSIITVYIMRYLKRSFRTRYFSLNQLVVSEDECLNTIGLIIIFGPIFIGGGFLGYDSNIFNTSDSLLYGSLVGFLIVWPIIQYPYHILENNAFKKLKTIYFVYLLYVLMCSVMSLFGFLLFSESKSMMSGNLLLTTVESWYNSLTPFKQFLISILVPLLGSAIYKYIVIKISSIRVNENKSYE